MALAVDAGLATNTHVHSYVQYYAWYVKLNHLGCKKVQGQEEPVAESSNIN